MKEPKIRFKGFSGEWKMPKLGDVFEIRNGYTPSKAVSAFWTNGTVPWFRMEDIRDKGGLLKEAYQKVTQEAVKGGGLFEANSILLATTATIGVHAMLIADSLANQQFTNLKIRKSLVANYTPMYIYYSFFGIDEWCIKNSNAGGLLSVNMTELCKLPFLTPSLSEQRTLSSYFTSLDAQISASTSRLALLKQMKAASLQTMFPQEGETVPKVRFKGFEGEWKKVKFDKAFSFLKNNSLSRAELCNDGDIINIHYGDVLIKYGDILDIGNDEVIYVADSNVANKLYTDCPIVNGDIIIADAAEDFTVGKCVEVQNVTKQKIVSGLHTIPCRPLESAAPNFWGYYINSNSFHRQLLPMIQGSKISSISKTSLSATYVVFPVVEEQQSIASFFTSLDRQIALHTQRLEKLKQIKAACLDKMFV